MKVPVEPCYCATVFSQPEEAYGSFIGSELSLQYELSEYSGNLQQQTTSRSVVVGRGLGVAEMCNHQDLLCIFFFGRKRSLYDVEIAIAQVSVYLGHDADFLPFSQVTLESLCLSSGDTESKRYYFPVFINWPEGICNNHIGVLKRADV